MGVEIKNLAIRNIEYRQVTSNMDISNVAIYVSGSVNNVSIHHNVVDMVGFGVIVDYSGPISRNISIYSNTFTNIMRCMFINSTDPNGTDAYDYRIYNNRMDH